MAFGIMTRKNNKRRFRTPGGSLSLESALYVFVDAADGTQTIDPEDGGLYVIEAAGQSRAFYFEENLSGTCANCELCALGGESSAYKNAVCRKMLCIENNVFGREYVANVDKGVFEPIDETEVAPETVEPQVDDAPETIEPEPEPEQKPKRQNYTGTPEQRRADWELYIKDLESQAQRAAEESVELKQAAKDAAKRAQQLRAKIFDAIWQGSENFEPETPLFNGIDAANE